MKIIADYEASERCQNPSSYGEICVGCNICGRFNRKTMWKCRYDYYIGEIKECLAKMEDESYQTELQQENLSKDIQYCARRLKECIRHLKWEKDND